jgi:hypothetical protein
MSTDRDPLGFAAGQPRVGLTQLYGGLLPFEDDPTLSRILAEALLIASDTRPRSSAPGDPVRS